jgi:hypothetical protein
MKILNILILFWLILISTIQLRAQKSGYIWAFGDSSGIDFNNLSAPQPIVTSMDSRGSCVSIADTSGNLLFYANTRAATAGNTTKVYNRLHQEMPNGSNIIGQGWYKELVIIPMPDSTSKYYIFSISITSSVIGFYYSVVDMTLNNGLGDVTTKNVRIHDVWMADCLKAIKHGNGRDWWLYMRTPQNNFDNKYYRYLVSPNGIDSMPAQPIGTGSQTGFIEFSWNKQGDKMAMVNFSGLIEMYDFDRCTGLFSNPITIRQPVSVAPAPCLWSCEFSASGNFLYVSASPSQPDSNRLIQVDLRNYPNNIVQDTIYSVYYPNYTMGALKRGPDDKIYLSCAYTNAGFNYPYADSMYNQYNMNLGVINSPDSLGLACDFQPWSFYLNGKRTYWGLPNNPDYDMGPVVGSVCDSLSTGFATITNTKGVINKVFPNPNNGAFYIELTQTFASPVWAELYDVQGKLCARQLIDNTHYTTPIRFEQVNAGIYTLKLSTNKIGLGTVKIVVTE